MVMFTFLVSLTILQSVLLIILLMTWSLYFWNVNISYDLELVERAEQKYIRKIPLLIQAKLVLCKHFEKEHTTWKVSLFRVILVRIFPHLNWIRRDTEYFSVFSPNAGKIRTRIIPNKETFYAVAKTNLRL